jgi:prophage regulatory protein
MPMLIRPEILAALRIKNSALYEHLAAGLLPPLVKLGSRRVALPESEVEAILIARVAGQTDDEIKALVKRLVVDRSVRLAAIQPSAAAA